MIKIDFKSTKVCFKKGNWKFNSNLLKSECFCQEIITLINNITTDSNLVTYRSKWEYLKYKVCQTSISISKILNRESRKKEIELISEINSIYNSLSINENCKQKLILLQSSLDNIYLSKAKGAYIRSRAKWIEEGERSSAYFCRLEKRRQERNAIRKLLIDNQECINPDLIAKEIFKYYSELYSSSFSSSDANMFFEHIKMWIPRIDESFKNICEDEIHMDEVEKAMKCLSLDKSPGSDGLTSNFYRHFWEHLKNLLFCMLKEISESHILPTTMTQGLITLIPKPGKDSKLIDNLRPITLLNTDYKILTHIYANRLKSDITQIISDTQSGFIKGRSIHNNIRLVLDLLEYNHLIEDEGFILFLDFF